ncbi:solute carrier organic anion transporter [Nereida sp. MMG025]|uniref:solute carrier organic anion transporter n=1 Tax=Nereida sp. MMG025 TaxID=2909981 RepID=UPI001F242ED0|nr:solute carrier organic anion transporter [Nereida sp. MMG025]MCF6445874.1 solute carrier organic anion transporter [Nereida sp. MMG025]
MSAPDTNVEKQTKRHRPSLVGIGAVLAFAALLFAGYMLILADRGITPQGAETQIDGRTGQTVAAD